MAGIRRLMEMLPNGDVPMDPTAAGVPCVCRRFGTVPCETFVGFGVDRALYTRGGGNVVLSLKSSETKKKSTDEYNLI